MGVLSGYRVIDLTIAMAGPLAAMRLGDLGADVIKVEPTGGEWQRHTAAGGAAGKQVNASFLSLNRNKRSLAVDLKSAEGREIVLDLARGSDVFLQNYRPGVAERLGMDYESIRAARPDIVYVSISGYGESGPYANRPGQDMLLQAMSGAMLNVGRAGDPPAPAGTYAVDAITGYGAFEGALAGLLHRERTGEGQLVTVNMLDSAIAVQAQELSIYTVGGVPQHRGREPHGHTYIRAPYGTFATADGYLALAFPHLADLGELLGIPEFGRWTTRWTGTPGGTRSPRWSGPGCRADHRGVAGAVLRARDLGRPGVQLRGRARRPAGAAQRLAGQLRPSHRGAGHHARVPVPVQRDPAGGAPRRPAGRGADPGDPGRAGVRRGGRGRAGRARRGHRTPAGR